MRERPIEIAAGRRPRLFLVLIETCRRRPCAVWTIRPASTLVTGTDPNPKSLNTLLLIDDFSKEVVANFGDYYLSFAITVAR